MSTALQTLTSKLAARLGMEGSQELEDILKTTAFKQRDGKPPSDAQMTALMIVANQYGLNPWTKEIYAYPDKQNGIVPVVGVDGWSRIINAHPQMDGVKFTYSAEIVEHKGKTCHEWIECAIYRKDRSNPTVIREFFAEVVRSVNFNTPWDSHPNRMHRHKSLIQGARIAFGFAGIYDQDEAERIVERDMGNADVVAEDQPLPDYPKEQFDKNFPTWRKAIAAGDQTADSIIAKVSTKYTLSPEQKAAIRADQETGEIPGNDDHADFYAAYENAEEQAR